MIRQQAVLSRGGKNVVREHAAPTRLPLDGGRRAPRGGDNPPGFMGRTFGLNQRRFGAGLAAIETLAETAGFLSLQHFARGGFAKRKISPRRRGLLPR